MPLSLGEEGQPAVNAAEHHQVELTRQNAASKGWRVGRSSVAIAIAITITIAVAIAIAITAMATIAIPSHIITAIVWHMAGVAVPVAVQVWPLIVKILTTIVTTTTIVTSAAGHLGECSSSPSIKTIDWREYASFT
eukprot:CAMPEP_0182602516 /NCGR_PEP_ID=MMETSP1324-20130603/92029_1 /TAXON_ID=236786 /ORGANISM="Florenciella sp., Strain RCC1587" /LENGTH=135 /DNA_ID=CAMNT_0024820435 /DNA_START=204 /DNA_END=612 /DNA_ORIENTATION=-